MPLSSSSALKARICDKLECSLMSHPVLHCQHLTSRTQIVFSCCAVLAKTGAADEAHTVSCSGMPPHIKPHTITETGVKVRTSDKRTSVPENSTQLHFGACQANTSTAARSPCRLRCRLQHCTLETLMKMAQPVLTAPHPCGCMLLTNCCCTNQLEMLSLHTCTQLNIRLNMHALRRGQQVLRPWPWPCPLSAARRLVLAPVAQWWLPQARRHRQWAHPGCSGARPAALIGVRTASPCKTN